MDALGAGGAAATRVRLTLRPGKKGTLRLAQKYGARLVCVRYRYDASRAVRIKTVELVEEVVPWKTGGQRRPAGGRVAVWIAFDEVRLQERVRARGGSWCRSKGVWRLDRDVALRLGLRGRIVQERLPVNPPSK